MKTLVTKLVLLITLFVMAIPEAAAEIITGSCGVYYTLDTASGFLPFERDVPMIYFDTLDVNGKLVTIAPRGEYYDKFNKVGYYDGTRKKGDVNGDGEISVTDLVSTIYFSLGNSYTDANREVADMNNDGLINTIDINVVATHILEPWLNQTEGYYILDEESLNGWDFGVTDGEYCITTMHDDNGGTTVCAIDTKSGTDYSFWVDFDNKGEVIGFATPTTYYSVKEEDSEYLFYSYKNGDLTVFSVNKSSEHNIQTKALSRAARAGNIFESFFEGTYNVFVAGRNSTNLGTDLHEGRWGDFLKDLGNLIGNNILDKLQNGGLLGVLANEQINFLQNQLNKHNSEQLYGNAQIKITSIDKQYDESYSVNAEVTGLSSIQTTLAVVSETSYQEVTNHVYAGVVCRKSYSAFVNYYTKKVKEVEVTGGGSEMYISFQLPKLDKGTYYVKPYLRSSINDIIKNAGFSYINYGQEKEIHVIGGKINKIEQVDANCTGDGNATFVLYADAEVDSNDGLEDWGVYYEKDGQYYRFSASWATSKVREDVRMEINLSKSEFDNVDYEHFTASKKMSFGIFKKHKNAQGVYDYGYYEYGDQTSYTLTFNYLRAQLEEFYYSANGENWTRNDNWCTDEPITSWYGVSKLYGSNNIVLSLRQNNLSGNAKLTECSAIETLFCNENQLSSLDVSGCSTLSNLYCDNNKLTDLNVSGCSTLRDLRCYSNQLSILDVSRCSALSILYCHDNKLTGLDASWCSALRELRCYSNQLSILDVSRCSALLDLFCYMNQLTSLDVSKCSALLHLSCGDNQLSKLNVSGCSALRELTCYSNQLSILDVSECSALTLLACYMNQLTSLDVSKCTALSTLWCGINQLTSLDVSQCTALSDLECTNNRINQIIPSSFKGLVRFEHDPKYFYSYDYSLNTWQWTENKYGWWYPGEPDSHHHRW